jgi:hypothetical protein
MAAARPQGCGAKAMAKVVELSGLNPYLRMDVPRLETRNMRLGWKAGVIAAVMAVAFASGAAAQTPPSHKTSTAQKHASATPHHGYGHGRARVGYAPGTVGARYGHRGHYANLVGDPHSGLGFYALPLQYRVGAWRYRMRTTPPPWANPVRSAVAADAIRTWSWIPTEATSYRYGVFDPNEGVGTPFFAGYYSQGDRDDDDDDDQPFGRPLF